MLGTAHALAGEQSQPALIHAEAAPAAAGCKSECLRA